MKATMDGLENSPNLIGLRSVLGPADEFLARRRNETTDFRAFRHQMKLFADSELSLNSSRVRLNKSDDGYTVGHLANQFGLDKRALMSAAQRSGSTRSSAGQTPEHRATW